jgi:hypothetical protein
MGDYEFKKSESRCELENFDQEKNRQRLAQLVIANLVAFLFKN